MLRLLANIPLPLHLLTLLLVVGLRLPVFAEGFFLNEESMLMVVGHKLGLGASLYQGAWFDGLPMMPWFYGFFAWVFGDNALTAIRIFSCGYIYFCAVYFAGLLANYRLYRVQIWLLPLLFVVLISVPWYAQEMESSLFSLLPMMMAFHAVIQIGNRSEGNYRLMFRTGILMMLCILAGYKSVFILLGFVLAYLVLNPPKIDELAAMAGGLVMIGMILIGVLYFRGNLADFWDQAILYYLDRIRISSDSFYDYQPTGTLLHRNLAWGMFAILAAVGLLHYRFRFYSHLARVRAIELVMFIWLLSASAMLLIKINRLEQPDFVLLVPPLVFYAARALELKPFSNYKRAFLSLGLIIPALMYLNYWAVVLPGFDLPWQHLEALSGGMTKQLTTTPPVVTYLEDKAPSGRIWIMDRHPEWYLRSDRKGATPFLDMRMVWYRFPYLRQKDEKELSRRVSKVETPQAVFEAFDQDLPVLIIDPKRKFANLQTHFPLLLDDYVPIEIDTLLVYQQKDQLSILNP